MENFYFIFKPTNDNWETFYTSGFRIGFIILLSVTILLSIGFFIISGRKTDRYSTRKHWLYNMSLNFFLIFLITLFVESYSVFENVESIFYVHLDIWIFSLINGLIYGTIFYSFWSVIFNNFSIHSKYIPINLFKK